ncbi:FtsX-like permease family protein [Janibacter sp. YIM B02568]|uniref:ABC transporter permease n=1 Tax=Janibacter endophyticus TaxID=2806261 RepID=UPI0019500F9C|nr:FtsX-like permease family protein [Janibacter endophyticus]MBM6545329.1 FtsX-like permease family protein [Janibacter endophyticus]
MLRSTFKALLARKLRLLMSAMAIILGVGFVAGSLIFTDTLGRTFDGIMEGTVGDVVVQSENALMMGPTGPSTTLAPADLDTLRALDGVERVDGNIDALGVFVVGENGNVVGGQGAPALAFNHNDAPNQLGEEVLSYEEGAPPQGDSEVAIDVTTAERAGLSLGDEAQLVTSGEYPEIRAKVVGLVQFGEGGMAGASIAIFDTPTAQKYFLGGQDGYTSAWVTTAEGASQEDVAAAAADVVPEGFGAETGKKIADESADQIQEALGFITTFLLVFAGIALFVGSFLIINTFSILVAQRGRELAMLRAIGATRGQITRSVLVEALVVGLIGSVLGLVVGVLLAVVIRTLFATIGLDMSGTGLVFSPRTVLASFAVGILVTLLAAYVPARRAGRVAPVEAMRETSGANPESHPVRFALELALFVLGVLAFAYGLFLAEDREVWWVGGGTVGMLLGLAFLSPLLGKPLIHSLGWLYRRAFGSVGRMAEQNAVRNPGRTAATASALMIGMTLVALMGVVSASTKASIDKQIEEQFLADYAVSNAIGQPFSAKVTEQIAQTPGVAAASPVRYAPAEIEGRRFFVTAIDPESFAEVAPIQMIEGQSTDLDTDSVLVPDDEHSGRSVGDALTVEVGGTSREMAIAGFFKKTPSLGGFLFSLDGFEKSGLPPADNLVYVVADGSQSTEELRSGLEDVIKDQPLVTLKDQEGYAAEQRQSINQLLYLIYGLLAMAIVIAILGIVNTLGLSVMERTREIGLLRAVGLGRGQLRRMVRLEAIAIALLGAVLGISLGVVSGVAIQRSLVDDGITDLAIPWGQLVVFLVLAGVIGVLAAVWPAWRASRMKVLDAISTE